MQEYRNQLFLHPIKVDYHRLITIQIEHKKSSFQDLGVFVHKNLETEVQRRYAHAALNYKTERESVITQLWASVSRFL